VALRSGWTGAAVSDAAAWSSIAFCNTVCRSPWKTLRQGSSLLRLHAYNDCLLQQRVVHLIEVPASRLRWWCVPRLFSILAFMRFYLLKFHLKSAPKSAERRISYCRLHQGCRGDLSAIFLHFGAKNFPFKHPCKKCLILFFEIQFWSFNFCCGCA
jgi:hypothetical protein